MLAFEYKNISELQEALINFRVLFSYHSNKIENEKTNYKDVKEIFEGGKVTNFSGDYRALLEIQNQKECYKYIIDKLVIKKEIDEKLIKEIHKILVNGTYDEIRYVKGERPGEYKKGDYIVGVDEIGSDAKDVQKDINDLLNEVNSSKSLDYLTIAAYFHYRFEAIHPFADGNGRVGRTLLNYYFVLNNIKPLIIYDEDKKLYYECLQAMDKKQDLEPLKRFLEYEQEKTWRKKNININNLNFYL